MVDDRPAGIDAAKQRLGQTKDLAHGPQDPELRARVLALHSQGHGPCRIARATGISRKQVARLLESEGIVGPSPIVANGQPAHLDLASLHDALADSCQRSLYHALTYRT